MAPGGRQDNLVLIPRRDACNNVFVVVVKIGVATVVTVTTGPDPLNSTLPALLKSLKN